MRGALAHLACSAAWIDALMDALEARRVDGRRVLPIATSGGRMKTRVADLFLMMDSAGLYPPRGPHDGGDPLARRGLRRSREVDVASQMQPCLTAACTPDPEEGRSVLYPATYVRRGGCYACHANRTMVDPEVAAAMGVEVRDELSVSAADAGANEVLLTADGRRRLPAGVAPVVWDDQGWRRTKLKYIGILGDDVRAAIAAHRYYTYVPGRVKHVTRGLATLGHIVDFLALGHSLAEVVGLTAGAATDIAEAVERYPREQRPRVARPPKWRRVHLKKIPSTA